MSDFELARDRSALRSTIMDATPGSSPSNTANLVERVSLPDSSTSEYTNTSNSQPPISDKLVERTSLPVSSTSEYTNTSKSQPPISDKLVERASLPVSPTAHLEPQFHRYYRRLPHWRLTGANYFVTWRLYSDQPDLSELERDNVLAAMSHFDGTRYKLYAWVVMNDHCHALLQPKADHELEQILHTWKSYTANQLQRRIQRTGRIWQEEPFDRIIRDEDDFWEKANYILENPRRRWQDCHEYRWAGIHVTEEAGRDIHFTKPHSN